MDDFLHNLRSGKLKQTDRSRRDYTDYKGPQRRAGNERRKPDYYTKVTNENFALIKETLDVLAENQTRIADTIATQNITATRIANSLEALATMIGRKWGYEDLLPHTDEADTMASRCETDPASSPSSHSVAAPQAAPAEKAPSAEETSSEEEEEPSTLDVIAGMREEGESWEKIARYLDNHQVPTVSGKGKWRGPAVKKLWEAHFASKAS
ncbi:hypothetical protein DESC_350017 [Desulfosarcina cetonica]|uniref:hypothetical protein n=1 Tax=Desulfosarcina cetonica TaxID=90730 RepID=UPI0006D122D2|nr:hypothetical protein [Desulfosarcina cetonica]VTR65552.1 hypothetical protein DESC_350017 [Desulfosarcina cetonica]